MTKVAVIGSGVTGIITASVLQRDGHEVVLMDKSPKIGGNWVCMYPGARLQNTRDHYFHPDFSYPYEPDLHPTAPQIQQYLEQCVEHFELNVRLETEVLQLVEADNGWKVITSSKGKTTREHFDFCVIASGHFSLDRLDYQKKELPWDGMEDFEENGGTILSRRDITDLDIVQDKRVVVVGFGKTAVDMCQFASEHNATCVTHIFGTARWLFPVNVFGLHFSWLFFNRTSNETIPAWGYPNPVNRFLHKHCPWLYTGFWWMIQKLSWAVHSRPAWFKSSKLIRERFRLLKPQHHILRDHRSAAAFCPNGFFSLVASGHIVPVKGTIVEFTPSGISLEDGTEIEADVVLACIGNSTNTDSFPYVPEHYRSFLEQHRRGLQLYRHMIHPAVPNLSFAGWNHGLLHATHTYLGAIWLSCHLRGEMQVPPIEEQLDTMQRIAAWKAQHMSYEPTANTGIHTRMLHYNDTMLLDLGLNPRRKSNPIAELFGRYGAADYAGVLREVQAKRMDAKAHGGLMLYPIKVDM